MFNRAFFDVCHHSFSSYLYATSQIQNDVFKPFDLFDPMNTSFPPGPPPNPGSGGPPAPPITDIQRYLALIGYSVLLLLGFIGHISSFITFSRPLLSAISTSCLFIALTITDCLYLLLTIYDLINTGLRIPDGSANVSSLCRCRHFIQWTSMCSNAWLLVMIAADRWIRVRFPLKSKRICTPRHAWLTSIAIVIVSAGFNSHVLGPSYGRLQAGIMTVCGPSAYNQIYNVFIRQIWPTLFSCVQILLPALLMTVFSLDTFHRVVQQRHIQKSVQRRRRTQLDHHMLLIMLATIILFIITLLPMSLFNIMLSPLLNKVLTQTQALELSSIVTWVAAINYTMDFYTHCLTSRLFRQELLQFFRKQVHSARVHPSRNTHADHPV